MRTTANESTEGDLSIGDTAEATGISTETLRIWERRYGRPVPVRRPSGHRRYTAEQVRWLRRVAEAVARGYRPGVVVPMSDHDLGELLEDDVAAPPPTRPEIARMLAAVRRLDGAEFIRQLETTWAPRGPLAFLVEIVSPLIEAIGRAWADGDLAIRHEHYASGLLDDFLRAKRTQFVAPPNGPRVLLAALSGETHALGLRMAGLVCASEGVVHRVLGPDTPIEEIAASAIEADVDGVGISVSLATGGIETDRALAALRDVLPDRYRLVAGGRGARGIRRGPRQIEYVESLPDWARWLRALRQSTTRGAATSIRA